MEGRRDEIVASVTKKYCASALNGCQAWETTCPARPPVVEHCEKQDASSQQGGLSGIRLLQPLHPSWTAIAFASTACSSPLKAPRHVRSAYTDKPGALMVSMSRSVRVSRSLDKIRGNEKLRTAGLEHQPSAMP